MAGTVTRRNSTPVLENSQGDDSKAKGGKSLLKAALIVLAVWRLSAYLVCTKPGISSTCSSWSVC